MVLENGTARVVAVEVKASSTVRAGTSGRCTTWRSSWVLRPCRRHGPARYLLSGNMLVVNGSTLDRHPPRRLSLPQLRRRLPRPHVDFVEHFGSVVSSRERPRQISN
jgi:hypothetical protein